MKPGRLHLICILILLAAITPDEALAAAKTFTGAGGNNDWSNPGNWNPPGVPGAADDVTIPAGKTVDFDTSPVAVKSLDNAGTIRGVTNLNNPFGDVTITTTGGFTNTGTIHGDDGAATGAPGRGVDILAGGGLTNGGTIRGGDSPVGGIPTGGGNVFVTGGTVTNGGTIRGGNGTVNGKGGDAHVTTTGGDLTNQSGGTIKPGAPGAGGDNGETRCGAGGAGHVINDGTIGNIGPTRVEGLAIRLGNTSHTLGTTVTMAADDSVSARDLGSGGVSADLTIQIAVCLGLLDLSLIPSGRDVFVAGTAITVRAGSIHLDPGVNLASITSPDATQPGCGTGVPSASRGGLAALAMLLAMLSVVVWRGDRRYGRRAT